MQEQSTDTTRSNNAKERRNISFAKSGIEGLEKMKKSTGLSLSDLVRRAVDEYLERHAEKK